MQYPHTAIAAVFAIFILAGCDGNSENNVVYGDRDIASDNIITEATLADPENEVAASLSLESNGSSASTDEVFSDEIKPQTTQMIAPKAVGAPQLVSASTAGKPIVPPAPPAAFAQCAICHTVKAGDASGIGPNLHGVYSSKAGAKAGYSYSPAMADSGIVWTRAKLAAYLADPRGVVPGTKMIVPGVADAGKLKDIMDYLEAIK